MNELERIKGRLKQNHLPFIWLMFQLKDKGISTDKTELSSVFSGKRKGNKADLIVIMSKEILDVYERGISKSSK